MAVLMILNLIGGLGVFLFGMKIMSDGIHKTAGERFQALLRLMTGRPFAAILTGVATTALVQSSSATTVMLVSLVNAQLVNLSQAIGVIMGANIGTTFTAWLVSFFGFTVKITSFALPAIALSVPLHFSKRERLRDISGILFGFGMIFLGLYEMKEAVGAVQDNAEALRVLRQFTDYGHLSLALFVVVGTLLTIAVQSSSAAMTITLTLAFNGWIPFPIAVAIVLGENIGTTITAFLASLEMSTNAKRAARAHMVFNLIGVFWVLVLFNPLLRVVDFLVPGAVTDPASLPFHLSAFHTLFNVANTLLLVWFIPLIEKLVVYMVRERPVEADEPYRLPNVRTQVVDQAEVRLINARGEVTRMSEIVNTMMLRLMDSIESGKAELSEAVAELQADEERVDEMQDQLSEFLAETSTDGMTEAQAQEVRRLLRIVNELESISDACHKVVALYHKKRKKQLHFHDNANAELTAYAMNVMDFLKYNTDYLTHQLEEQDYEVAAEMEEAINKKRKALTKQSRKTIKRGGDLKGELLYMEIVRQMELVADFCLNISQAISLTKVSSGS